MARSVIIDLETTTLEPLEAEARIITIGMKSIHKSEPNVLYAENEKELLETFWKEIDSYEKVIGFNFEFDYRWLIVRSLANSVIIKKFFVTDLRTVLGAGNKFAKGKLDQFIKLIEGIESKFSGKDVATLWKLKEIDKIKAYNKEDILNTEKLYIKMKELRIID